MPTVPIVFGTTKVDLKPAPINPNWIKAGAPIARNALLSSSYDRTSCTLVWDCTPGEFEWRYDTNETIHILEGSIVLEDGFTPRRRLGPGDVVFFPAGAVVSWTVETHVRKLAFFHRSIPLPVALMSRAFAKTKRMIRDRFLPGSAPLPISVAPGMTPT